MTLFKKNTVFEEPPVTADKAKLIYELLKDKSPQAIRLIHEDDPADRYRMAQIMEVVVESERLEAEVINLVKNGASTKVQVVAALSSKLLDVSIVVTDIIAYSKGNPTNPPTFKAFKDSLNTDV